MVWADATGQIDMNKASGSERAGGARRQKMLPVMIDKGKDEEAMVSNGVRPPVSRKTDGKW